MAYRHYVETILYHDNEYLSYYDNFKKYLEENPDMWWLIVIIIISFITIHDINFVINMVYDETYFNNEIYDHNVRLKYYRYKYKLYKNIYYNRRSKYKKKYNTIHAYYYSIYKKKIKDKYFKNKWTFEDWIDNWHDW